MSAPVTEYVEVPKEFGNVNGVPQGNDFWVLQEDGAVVSVNFLCPCGCGRECYTPVTDATKGQLKTERHWLFSRGPNGRPTLTPSIRYLSGCKTHFNVTEGKVVTHGDSGK